MKKTLVLLATLISTSAFAHDSTWKLCQGQSTLFGDQETILVNLYEHRNSADGRATDLTLIFGGNLLNGSFDSTENDSGKVILEQDKYKSKFSGMATVNYSSNTLALKGTLNLSGSTTSVDSLLSCKTIRD